MADGAYNAPMSDARLRELERRMAAGDSGARTEWLLERLRAGQLDPEALELAAFAADGAARAALGPAAPSRAPDAPEPLARSLSRFGPRACVLAGVLGGEAAIAAAAEGPAEGRELARAALTAARAWIACPCPVHAAQANGAATRASEAASGSGYSWTILEPAFAAQAREELRREVSPPNAAPLRDMLPFARGGNGDDVAGVVLQDGTPLSTVCQVHLTWAMGPEAPGWPSLRLLPGAGSFVEETLLAPDYLDEDGERAHAAAIYAASFPAAPITLGLCPEVGAAIALCCAAAVLGPVETRAAVLTGLATWALE